MKLEAKDLRIGNLIYWDIPEKKNLIHAVTKISEEKIQTSPISLGESLNDYNGIELTEDWLVRCGFEYVTMGIFKLGEFTVTKWSGEICEYKSWTANGIEKDCVQLPYVHNLQNLYYELKKEELTIKNE